MTRFQMLDKWPGILTTFLHKESENYVYVIRINRNKFHEEPPDVENWKEEFGCQYPILDEKVINSITNFFGTTSQRLHGMTRFEMPDNSPHVRFDFKCWIIHTILDDILARGKLNWSGCVHYLQISHQRHRRQCCLTSTYGWFMQPGSTYLCAMDRSSCRFYCQPKRPHYFDSSQEIAHRQTSIK